MTTLSSAAPAPQTDADCERIVQQMLDEMAHMNQRMEKDREDINRLDAETARLRADTRALLISMGAKF